jgi:hypothetical protein
MKVSAGVRQNIISCVPGAVLNVSLCFSLIRAHTQGACAHDNSIVFMG